MRKEQTAQAVGRKQQAGPAGLHISKDMRFRRSCLIIFIDKGSFNYDDK